jgi:hypothetical protein
MRAIAGVLSLLLVLGIVGVLAKKQLNATSVPPALVTATPGAAPLQQSQQVQQQVKQSVEAAMQQARPMPDEK